MPTPTHARLKGRPEQPGGGCVQQQTEYVQTTSATPSAKQTVASRQTTKPNNRCGHLGQPTTTRQTRGSPRVGLFVIWTSLELDHCLLWNTRAQRVFSTVDQGQTNLIHDLCSCPQFTLSSVSSSACSFHASKISSGGEFCCCYYLYSRCQLDWMCPLKRERARHEQESELRLVNSLQTIVEIGRKSRS